MTYQVKQIPTDRIKFFVRRARRERPYARLKQSIKEVGLKTPIGVRDISDRAASRRKKPEGGLYQYELVYGQGRLQAFRELGIERIPALVLDVKEEEIVGRFLAENVMRRKLGWREKADLIRHDCEENKLEIDEIAEKYCLTQPHAMKYLRILTGASQKTLASAETHDFSLSETEKLTTLPLKDQDIVIEVLEEHGLDKAAIRGLVNEANKIKANGKLSRENLSGRLNELSANLKKCRERLKLRKLEYALGPQHIFALVRDRDFVLNAESAGIKLDYFMRP